MTNEERLRYRQGLYAIAIGMAGGAAKATPDEIQKRIMKVPDDKLLEITNRFGELAKSVLQELGLET